MAICPKKLESWHGGSHVTINKQMHMYRYQLVRSTLSSVTELTVWIFLMISWMVQLRSYVCFLRSRKRSLLIFEKKIQGWKQKWPRCPSGPKKEMTEIIVKPLQIQYERHDHHHLGVHYHQNQCPQEHSLPNQVQKLTQCNQITEIVSNNFHYTIY